MKKILLLFCCALTLLSCKKETATSSTNVDQIFMIGHHDNYDYHFEGDSTVYIMRPNISPSTFDFDLDGDGSSDFSIEANGQGAYRGTHRKWIKLRILGNQWAIAKAKHYVPLRECFDGSKWVCRRWVYSDNFNSKACTGTDMDAGKQGFDVPLRYALGDACSASDWTYFSTNHEDRELSLYYLNEDWDHNNMSTLFCNEIYNLYYANFPQEHYWLFRKTTATGEQYAWLKLKLIKEYPDFAPSSGFSLQIIEGACQGEDSK